MDNGLGEVQPLIRRKRAGRPPKTNARVCNANSKLKKVQDVPFSAGSLGAEPLNRRKRKEGALLSSRRKLRLWGRFLCAVKRFLLLNIYIAPLLKYAHLCYNVYRLCVLAQSVTRVCCANSHTYGFHVHPCTERV